jgi:hydroxymethylpyrimidine/phosphomethylpyrimidine kinase
LKTMLTIAGFDPSSGAGVTADLAVFAAEGCFGTACVTALTVQSTMGVRGVEAVEARVVAETLACLWEDLPADGVKIGMLATAGNVEAVAEFLGRVRGTGAPVVLDPVLRSSSGRELLSREGIDTLKMRLLPLVDWVTPNLAELGELAGLPVGTADEMEEGAAALRRLFPGLGVVVTGGHLAGNSADDLVVSPDGTKMWLRGERIASRATHGTGCAFSSSLACGLSRGLDGVEAARSAKGYVAEAIRQSEPMGRGSGPMNLLWPLKR